MSSIDDAIKKTMNDWTTRIATSLNNIEDTVSVKPMPAAAYGWGNNDWWADGSSSLVTSIDNGTSGLSSPGSFGDLEFTSVIVIRRCRNMNKSNKKDQYLFIQPISTVSTNGSFNVPDFMRKDFAEEFRLPHGTSGWAITDPVMITDLLTDHEDEFIDKWKLSVSTLRRACFELDKTIMDVYHYAGIDLEQREK